MIRVLVAEDESPILRGIVSMVEAADDRFTVAATAWDGQEAMDRLAETPVDVVITDINMPVCDGLALLAHIQEKYPNILTVVLSGYQEFSYAQSAIRYGVTDYLLKPVRQEQLSELLNLLAARHRENRATIRQQSLNEMMFEQADARALGSGCFGEKGDAQLLLVFCAGPLPQSPSPSDIPGVEFWKMAVEKQAVQKALSAIPGAYLLQGQSGAERVLVAPCESPAYHMREIQGLYNALNAYNCPVSAAGVAGVAVAGMMEGYFALRRTLAQQLVFARPGLWMEDSPPKPSEYVLPSHFERQLEVAVETNNLDGFTSVVSRALEEMETARATQVNLLGVVRQMAHTALRALPSYKSASSDYTLQLQGVVSSCYTYPSLYERLCRLLAGVFESFESYGDKLQLAEEVERYILQHLGEAITSQTLCAKFGFTHSYISKLFKAKHGCTPAEFLQRQRIEKAKTLLEEGGIRAKDVAQIVGYSDALYFSRVFKKETGVYPSEYRREKTGA